MAQGGSPTAAAARLGVAGGVGVVWGPFKMKKTAEKHRQKRRFKIGKIKRNRRSSLRYFVDHNFLRIFFYARVYNMNVGAAVKKTALKAMQKKQLPCSKKKSNRVSIFSPWRNRMVSVLPDSATAKRLYRWYIQELDFDARRRRRRQRKNRSA